MNRRTDRACPHCAADLSHLIDAADRARRPGRGDRVVCWTCGRPSVFSGQWRAENRAELGASLRHRGWVSDRAEALFRNDPEFQAVMAGLERLFVGEVAR